MMENMEKQIKIVYEDEYLLVLNKPSGVVVNISDTTKDLTLQHFIQAHLNLNIKNTKYNIEEVANSELTEEEIALKEFEDRSGILHRLDKDTSGVLLVAKTFESFKKFKELFKNREIVKEYWAVVMGDIVDKKIEIDAPIKRNPKNPMKFAVVSEGKPAVTIIEKVMSLVEGEDKFTMLKVYPKTGRTHQIRVHLSAINHPIASDVIYLTKHTYTNCLRYFDRLMLHARSLSFVHPYTLNKVTYEVELPELFRKYL